VFAFGAQQPGEPVPSFCGRRAEPADFGRRHACTPSLIQMNRLTSVSPANGRKAAAPPNSTSSMKSLFRGATLLACGARAEHLTLAPFPRAHVYSRIGVTDSPDG